MSLTWVEGKADVRSVSCVSSIGRRRGTLSTNAAWSGVAAHAVMRNPAHRAGRQATINPALYGTAKCKGKCLRISPSKPR